MCKVPFLKKIGIVPLKMSVNGNFTFVYNKSFKHVPLSLPIEGIKAAYEITELTNFVTINLISAPESNAQRVGITYSINFDYIDRSTGTKNSLILINSQRTSSIEINLSMIRDQVIASQNKIVFGFIIVIETTKINTLNNLTVDFAINRAVNSIYIYSSINNSNYGAQCKQWYNSESNLTLQGLSPCWRQLSLDFNRNFPIAFGEFSQDRLCNPENPQLCDIFHPRAKICYKSSSFLSSYVQHCCYTSDNIQLVGQRGGGALNRFSSNDVWNNYIRDIEPYLMCCFLSDNCKFYYEKRPSDDGARWTPPIPAVISGDPHLITLDGLSYTFNGYGEFILLEIDDVDFTVQVRMSPFTNLQGTQVSGTVISSIAIKSRLDTVQFDITRLGQVDILLNGRLLTIENVTLYLIWMN